MLTRYKGHGPSMFSVFKPKKDKSGLSKISYLIKNNSKPLRPLTSSDEKSEDPIDDVGVPTATIMSIPQVHYKHHSDLELSPIPEISKLINNFDLFIQKCQLCSKLCDFSDPDIEISAKRIKTATLQEIDSLFNNESNISLISNNSEIVDELFLMIHANLFRGIPMVDPKHLIYSDEPPVVETNWPHLQYVYSILIKFQKAKPNDPHVDFDFLNKMYSLLEAPDIQERNHVLRFFNNFYKQYPDRLTNILYHFESIVRDYIDRQIPPFPIIPILKFYLSLLQEPSYNIREQILTHFFDSSVLPILSSQHILSFYSQLNEIFDFFISANSSNVSKIIKKLISLWPESAASKQMLYINLINSTARKMPPEEFPKLAPVIITLYSKVSCSSHAKIVQASLKIWSDVKIMPMLMDNTAAIYPLILGNIQGVMKNHWNSQTRNSALDAMTSMHDFDPFVFDELTQQELNKDPHSTSKQGLQIAAQEHRNWALIARIASKTDNSINLARTLAYIQYHFTEPNPQTDYKRPNRSNSQMKPKIIIPSKP